MVLCPTSCAFTAPLAKAAGEAPGWPLIGAEVAESTTGQNHSTLTGIGLRGLRAGRSFSCQAFTALRMAATPRVSAPSLTFSATLGDVETRRQQPAAGEAMRC